MDLQGTIAFKTKAIEALSYFIHREQSIKAMTHSIDYTEITISYRAIAAMDFSNGLKER